MFCGSLIAGTLLILIMIVNCEMRAGKIFTKPIFSQMKKRLPGRAEEGSWPETGRPLRRGLRDAASSFLFDFFEKVLDLFFCLWHKRKINGRNAPGPKPAKPDALCGFLRLGPDQRGHQGAGTKTQTGMGMQTGGKETGRAAG
ncbi:hypothetical protein TH5_20875 [Thalassospira xianhensis MCCC 1A02616]|uniref:Uncharacterized protein n=1 Tax=Thalassospira xianhensis MCCC 1A02616 TaxID=1177929 RepID=A0A367U7E9_9PROT|nr:hypothetical protein TH5_20875 [Thalassospira xianhensis MCCC 1A02616]